MTIIKHSLGINIRTIGIGIIIVILLLTFLNPLGGLQFLGQSSPVFIIALIMLVGGQIIASIYKSEANNSQSKKSYEKLYSIIGISIILLVFGGILFLAYVSSR